MDDIEQPQPGRVICLSKGYIIRLLERYYLYYQQDNPPRSLLLRRVDYLPEGTPIGQDSNAIYLGRVTRWSDPESEPITDEEREMLRQRLTDAFRFMGDPAPMIC